MVRQFGDALSSPQIMRKSTIDELLVVTNFGQWKKQLITKDDPFHVHKTLGILCLCSFIWRFAHFGSADMGFLSYPQYTMPTVLLHFSLTASAFFFKLPSRRIKNGTRIWPEYRMHSMVFLCRSLVAIAMYWYEDRFHLPRWYDFNLFLVLATMLAADLCSASVGKEFQSNSVRDLDTHPAVKYFFSVMQFLATPVFLFGYPRCTVPFMIVTVVQLTPFLGTLRRKNLLGHHFVVFLYGVFLASSYWIIAFNAKGSMLRICACFGFVAAIWRMMPLPHIARPLQSKYLIWSTLGLIIRHFRFQFRLWSADDVSIAFHVILLLLLLLGYYKTYYGYNKSLGVAKVPTKNAA